MIIIPCQPDNLLSVTD